MPRCFPQNLDLTAPDLSQFTCLHERRPSRTVSAGEESRWVYVSCRLQPTNAPRQRGWCLLRLQPRMREDALNHRGLFDSQDELQAMPKAVD